MKKLSSNASLPQSGIRRMFDIAKDMDDVISFCLGEPDFDTPLHIKESAKKYLDLGFTHYSDNAGILELRQAIALNLEKYDKLKYDATSEIQVTIGGMQAIYILMSTLLDAGDEVLVADPCYANYIGEIKMNHGIPVAVPVYEVNNFNYTYEDLCKKVTNKTKALILNSPCNPTGAVADEKTLNDIARFACEYDLYVIYDAVYKHLLYDDFKYINIATLPGMKDRTLVVDSFSKTYAMTGWRLGYIAGPKEIISNIPKLQENMVSCAPAFIQYAGIEALQNGDNDIKIMNEEYTKRRKVLLKGIDDIPKLSYIKPYGAFYLFINISKTGLTSVEFCERLLKEQGVVLAPGSAFGKLDDDFVRLSYATSITNIEKGLVKIKAFVDSL
ncbi:MAG: pyridoxal phosphate-dependent aminotransferase [Bacilli bacterium]|jgi:aminotransferase|nr:pyridoxal phosphate-dependent aminotransferase [Bacilli bacterium]